MPSCYIVTVLPALTTKNATSSAAILKRLEKMCMTGTSVPFTDIDHQLLQSPRNQVIDKLRPLQSLQQLSYEEKAETTAKFAIFV